MTQYRPTLVEVSLPRVAQNVRHLRACLAGDAKLMAVVKADGYGHGAVQISACALAQGASALAVATVEEGVQLREAGLGAPILVLGLMDESAADAVVRHDLTQTIDGARALAWLSRAARAREKCARAHIKIDTGMGRVGVRGEAALLPLLEAVRAQKGVRVEGVYTHFATADGDLDYVRRQHERFVPLAAAARAAVPGLVVHAANSAALLRCPWTHHDMARAGIALYLPPDIPGGAPQLAQAMRWVTRAVRVKEIGAGETVGYGRAFAAGRPSRVMTVPVGYADGYHRAIGGRGAALVRGLRAPVIGRVCMDQAMLDVTDIPGAAVDDEVVLLGEQGGDEISAREMGAWCGMIDYEVVLSPTARVPRVYLP